MEVFQERVLQEKTELDEKLHRLSDFIAGDAFDKISDAEKDRLQRQAAAMGEYSTILAERVADF